MSAKHAYEKKEHRVHWSDIHRGAGQLTGFTGAMSHISFLPQSLSRKQTEIKKRVVIQKNNEVAETYVSQLC